MAAGEISITAANVQPSGGGLNTSTVTPIVFGATVTEMMPLYLAADGNYELGNCGAAATSQIAGVSLSAGGDGDSGLMAKTGAVVVSGATLTAGETYFLSDTNGKITPASNLSSGDYLTMIGIALTTSLMLIYIVNTGEQLP